MEIQTQRRREGEMHAWLALIRLLCAVSIWRTGMTRILPLCGAAAWWVILLCLLPGFASALLLRLVMRLTGADTLAEAVRRCLGTFGAVAAAFILTALLLLEGISSTTALITMFTEGIGTRGTQLTLAALTGGLLLFSLHREGLARAAYFLRWGMAAAAILLAFYLAGETRMDHLYPLYGEDRRAVVNGISAGMSIAWPLALVLTVPVNGYAIRVRTGIMPAFCAAGAMLLLILSVPHEIIIRTAGLADLLLMPVQYVPNAVRVIVQGLLMLVLFLSIGASAQLASNSLCNPWGRTPEWLPYALVTVLFLTQAADVSVLWQWIGRAEPWLILPLVALALVCLPMALLRRRRA